MWGGEGRRSRRGSSPRQQTIQNTTVFLSFVHLFLEQDSTPFSFLLHISSIIIVFVLDLAAFKT
jgi:hypothetical protein